jgi:hypothetical protein
MRTVVSVFAVGIAVALVAIVFAGTTSADQVVGPLSGALSSTNPAGHAGHDGSMMLLVKGNHHSNHHSGHHNGHHRNHRYHRDWWANPDYSWDSDSYGSDNQTCVWNGYSYTCYQPSDSY